MQRGDVVIRLQDSSSSPNPRAELFSEPSHKSPTAGAPRRPRSPPPFNCQSSGRAALTKQRYPALHSQLSEETDRDDASE
ncbi:hypothetical protein ROHU_007142 [Labeo rohita]|uniref:Uncharacterized protein n=1 Tax=Labeo rohita TaxID=84645 RepID=A0A498MJV4_LABRO|nr:hypothetical protein ROHU_007142 [Labeo rohita]